MNLHCRQLPCRKAEFLAKLSAYNNAREAHKLTEGVPAPFPEYEILRTIYEAGGQVVIAEEAVVSARYLNPEQTQLAVKLQGEPETVADAYLTDLVQDWTQAGGVIAPYQTPAVPSQNDLEAACIAGAGAPLAPRFGFDLHRAFIAHVISCEAYRLGVAPSALTGAQLAAIRARVAAIYKAL